MYNRCEHVCVQVDCLGHGISFISCYILRPSWVFGKNFCFIVPFQRLLRRRIWWKSGVRGWQLTVTLKSWVQNINIGDRNAHPFSPLPSISVPSPSSPNLLFNQEILISTSTGLVRRGTKCVLPVDPGLWVYLLSADSHLCPGVLTEQGALGTGEGVITLAGEGEGRLQRGEIICSVRSCLIQKVNQRYLR